MAEVVVKSLEELAKNGTTILCTIHQEENSLNIKSLVRNYPISKTCEVQAIWLILLQPSSNTFARFSHLLLLAQGDIAYMGELQGAASFFGFIDLPVPKNFNPCDHYIEQVALVPDDETQR